MDKVLLQPLHLAAENGHVALAEPLAERGAEVGGGGVQWKS